MDGMNPAEAQHFQRLMEAKQMKDFMSLYSNLVQRCFSDCINDFTSKSLSEKESGCVQKCADKFLKHSERVGQRFAEQNAAYMQQGAPGLR
ncbi:protein transporter tim9 [Saitoella coloradoensis]